MELKLDLNTLTLDDLEVVVRLARKSEQEVIEIPLNDTVTQNKAPERRNSGLTRKEIRQHKKQKYAEVYAMLKKHPNMVFRKAFSRVFNCDTYGEAYNEYREYCRKNKLEVLGLRFKQSIKPNNRKPNKFRIWVNQHFRELMNTGLSYNSSVRKLADFWNESQSNEEMANIKVQKYLIGELIPNISGGL